MNHQAILYDMDGVLTDSEPVITKASILALREHGVFAKEEDFKPFTGMGDDKFVGDVAEKYGLTYHVSMKQRAYEIYLSIVQDELTVYSGVLPCLRAIRDAGIRQAVASSSDLIKVDANLSVARIREGFFDKIITGSDVVNKKPNPEIYLTAARALGVAPEHCVVVEDALSGVQAAKNAGCLCAAVPTSFSADELKSAGADFVLRDISELPAVLLQ